MEKAEVHDIRRLNFLEVNQSSLSFLEFLRVFQSFSKLLSIYSYCGFSRFDLKFQNKREDTRSIFPFYFTLKLRAVQFRVDAAFLKKRFVRALFGDAVLR